MLLPQQQRQHPPRIIRGTTATTAPFTVLHGTTTAHNTGSKNSNNNNNNKNEGNTTTPTSAAAEAEDAAKDIRATRMSSSPPPPSSARANVVDRSTLTLLEHVNLNVPDHDSILPFYLDLLGCGLDPRKGDNVRTATAQASPPPPSTTGGDSTTETTPASPQPLPPKEKKASTTIWANCGASQFHLPHGEQAQRIPGKIGLSFRNWDAFCERVRNIEDSQGDCILAVVSQRGGDRTGRESVQLVDRYGNVFVCRPGGGPGRSSSSFKDETTPRTMQQPIIAPTETERWGEIAARYGKHETDCTGIEYVEFQCPRKTAAKIANFYETVLDATTSLLQDGDDTIAVIAFGNVDETGQADQSLIFRETDEALPPYDGHHIAMYVGESGADFEQAFRNADDAGIVWINPRFSDKADTLEGARQFKQFRFKDVIDLETGEVVFELEHEMRSIEHEAWPGQN
jgi:hypothetical protein